MQDDKLLIEKCISGCRRHQTILYNRYYRTMYNIVTKYIDCPHIAEEVVNDGFARAFMKIHLFRFDGSFEGWMRRIMFHAVADTIKTDDRIKDGKANLRKGFFRNVLHTSDGEERTDLFMVAPDQTYDYYKILESIDNILPIASCIAFKMFLGGFQHKEIAEKLNINEGTSKWHVSEARRIIREKLFNQN